MHESNAVVNIVRILFIVFSYLLSFSSHLNSPFALYFILLFLTREMTINLEYFISRLTRRLTLLNNYVLTKEMTSIFLFS